MDRDTPSAPLKPTGHRILHVDGQALYRLGLRKLLEPEPDLHVAGEASCLGTARPLLAATPFDLLILEINLPDGDGLNLLTTSPGRCLVLTSRPDSECGVAAVEAGAVGFVSKDDSPAAVLTAIRQVLSHRTHLPSTVLSRLLRNGTAAGRDLQGIGQLSAREREVFSLLGDGLTAKEIAGRLVMSVHTVDTHRERMKKKLKLANGAALTRQALEWKLKSRLVGTAADGRIREAVDM